MRETCCAAPPVCVDTQRSVGGPRSLPNTHPPKNLPPTLQPMYARASPCEWVESLFWGRPVQKPLAMQVCEGKGETVIDVAFATGENGLIFRLQHCEAFATKLLSQLAYACAHFIHQVTGAITDRRAICGEAAGDACVRWTVLSVLLSQSTMK